MGRTCAVPKCNTGYKSYNVNFSIFPAPKDIEQFKKWQAAIPGIVLKQSQCVCEKHFEEKCVLKEWVKHDSEGRIIAKVPYLRPRLVETAVPTIFDNFPTKPLVKAEPMDGMYNDSNFIEVKCEIFEELATPDAEDAHSSSTISCSPQNTIQQEVYPVALVASNSLTSVKQEVVDSKSTVCKKNFHISKIIINDLSNNVVTSEKNSIAIPRSWGVTEYAEENGQRVVFSNILRSHTNGIASTFINKSVEVQADKSLHYCVYGRLIDPEKCQLPSVLTDTALLPKILDKFRMKSVCQGVGPVNTHYLSTDCVFQDSIQRWRDNDCTLLSKQKRCVDCKKMRNCTLRKELRSNKSESIEDSQLSNSIKSRKIILKKKKRKSQ